MDLPDLDSDDLDDPELADRLLEMGYRIEDVNLEQYTNGSDETDDDVIEAQVTFDEMLAVLGDPQHVLTVPYLRAFSDLTGDQLAQLQAHWPTVPPARRVAILEHLLDNATGDWSIDGHSLAQFALNDSLGAVRSLALEILAEECPLNLIPLILDRLVHDGEVRVRAAAAHALGQFMSMQEMEVLSEQEGQPVQDALMQATRHDASLEVQRRALESLGYIDHPGVQALIQRACEHSDSAMQASALQAIAHSLNPKRWRAYVTEQLSSGDPAVVFQAIYAAGELQLKQAESELLTLLLSNDVELRDAAVWALGEIAGPRAEQALMAMQQTYPDDDNLQELIDDALANIQLENSLDIDDSLHWSNPI